MVFTKLSCVIVVIQALFIGMACSEIIQKDLQENSPSERKVVFHGNLRTSMRVEIEKHLEITSKQNQLNYTVSMNQIGQYNWGVEWVLYIIFALLGICFAVNIRLDCGRRIGYDLIQNEEANPRQEANPHQEANPNQVNKFLCLNVNGYRE